MTTQNKKFWNYSFKALAALLVLIFCMIGEDLIKNYPLSVLGSFLFIVAIVIIYSIIKFPKTTSEDFTSNKIVKYPNAHRSYREQNELINNKN